MKKTYTIAILASLSALLFSYGRLTGTQSTTCTRKAGLHALNNNPSGCFGTCHGGGGVVTDTVSTIDTTGISHGNDTTGLGGNNTTTGLADLAFREGISVYPTVTTGKMCVTTMETSSDMVMYGIYTLDGRLLDAGMLPGRPSTTHMDIHALPAAQYIIRVSDGSHSASYHIIRQ